MNTGLLNKIIIATVDLYIYKALENDECYRRDDLLNLKCKIAGYKTFHNFTDDELKLVDKIGKEPYMNELSKISVDYAIYAVFILIEWIDIVDKKHRIGLNISDYKIKKIKIEIIKDMLSLKVRDSKLYDEIKQIIDDTKITAKNYVNYLHNHK